MVWWYLLIILNTLELEDKTFMISLGYIAGFEASIGYMRLNANK